MRRARWLHVGLLTMLMSLPLGTQSRAQLPGGSAISPNSGVQLKTFTPVDSLFLNPTTTTVTVALVHTVVGAPTDYRVSRFSDFHDTNWVPYTARPTITLANTVFTATPGNSSSSQVTLFLQLRAKNPKAGQPLSFINGKTQVQPDFFMSDALGRRIRIVYAG